MKLTKYYNILNKLSNGLKTILYMYKINKQYRTKFYNNAIGLSEMMVEEEFVVVETKYEADVKNLVGIVMATIMVAELWMQLWKS